MAIDLSGLKSELQAERNATAAVKNYVKQLLDQVAAANSAGDQAAVDEIVAEFRSNNADLAAAAVTPPQS